MSIDYEGMSRNAIHSWVERTHVVPFLEGLYLDKLDDPEQYPTDAKNADRKLSFVLAPTVTIERKHDRAHDRPNLPVELLGSQPPDRWFEGRQEPATTDGKHRNLTHLAYVPRIMAYANDCPANEHGLITANLSHLGSHYLQYIKAYPTGKEGDESYERPKAEAWLFSSRILQAEVRANIKNLAIGGTRKYKEDENGNVLRDQPWSVILAYIQPYSLFGMDKNTNVSKSVVLGPVDITDAYARLWRMGENHKENSK